MKVDASAIFERAWGRAQEIQLNICPACGGEGIRRGESHATGKIFRGRACDVQGCSLTGNGLIGRASVKLNSTHADALAGGKYFQFLFAMDRAGDQGSGDDR